MILLSTKTFVRNVLWSIDKRIRVYRLNVFPLTLFFSDLGTLVLPMLVPTATTFGTRVLVTTENNFVSKITI